MIVTPVTELEAVNEIIGAIGESPVNSIENPMNVDLINAIRMLNLENRKFQSKGWSFNTISPYTLNPDVSSNKIRWSDTFLFLKGTDGTRYIKRNDYVFDMTHQTDTFTTSIQVECILLVPFTDMPEQARQYITAKVARDFQVRYLGDGALTQELTSEELEAWKDLQEFELDLNNFNMLDNIGIQPIRRRS